LETRKPGKDLNKESRKAGRNLETRNQESRNVGRSLSNQESRLN
jgi:hypothetical protein